MIAVLSIVISGIALLLSIITFFTNKAKHNLQQLQSRYQVFCDNFKSLVMFGNYQQLINFKYDLENIIIYSLDDMQCGIEFNKLQKNVSANLESSKIAYLDFNSTLDFFEIKSVFKSQSANKFLEWINNTINIYYAKLNTYYGDLYEINYIGKKARDGVLEPKDFETIKQFYSNIKEIVNMNEVLLLLNRETNGAFGKLSVRGLSLFYSNSKAIRKITNFINSFIKEYGLDDAIYKKDYKKVSVVYKDFCDEAYLKYLTEEENEFKFVLDAFNKTNSKAKAKK